MNAPVAVSPFVWHGDADPEPPPWLVRGILPQRQTAIVGGQYSAGKTFVTMALARCVMSGEPFLGCEIVTPGAVLWLAAEGRDEVLARLEAACLYATGEAPKRQPFAVQLGGVPPLTSADAYDRLYVLAKAYNQDLTKRFAGDLDQLGLVMIVIDTIGSAADFQDENSASETQKVFNVLRRLSDATGALVVCIDHFGKTAESGIRGSSAKAAAADAILAVLADKNADGDITNRRLRVEKLRQAPTGRVVPFDLVSVAIGQDSHVGAVRWDMSKSPAPSAQPKAAWSGASRVLKSSIDRALIEDGAKLRPFGSEGPEVQAVPYNTVRAEFYKSYAAETQDAKRRQFTRLLDKASASGLIATRDVGGTDWIWIVAGQDNPDN